MFNNLLKLTAKQQGYILMFAGVVLLLHTLNILDKWLDWILVLFAITIFVYGMNKADVFTTISKFMKQERK